MTPIDPTFVDRARRAARRDAGAGRAGPRPVPARLRQARRSALGAVAPDVALRDNAGVVESFKQRLPPARRRSAPSSTTTQGFDHYFVTNIADEITKLDNGTFAGWTRTGESFNVYSDVPAGTRRRVPLLQHGVRRPRARTSTRRTRPSARSSSRIPNWQFEAVVFSVPRPTPRATAPAARCPSTACTTTGQGGAPNHRYTTSLATRTAMIAKGWIPEGNGTLGVIMCSPATDARCLHLPKFALKEG